MSEENEHVLIVPREEPIWIQVRKTALEVAIHLRRTEGLGIREITERLNESELSCFGKFAKSMIHRWLREVGVLP